MALKEFHLPDIGEGIAEGEIVRWLVKEGQQCKEEQPFVEVMTDKATVTITVPHDCVIRELRVKEGQVVPVESVIAVLDIGATAGAPAAVPAPKMAAHTPAVAATQPLAAAKPVVTVKPAAPTFVPAAPGKVLAAPATRRRARELGVDLGGVLATGPRGRVTNEDLNTFLAGGAKVAPAPVAAAPRPVATKAAPVTIPMAAQAGPKGREERVPFRGLRKKIAEAMTRSKHTAAHFTYVDDLDVTELVKLRKTAKDLYAPAGVKITYLPFIMKAIVEAMRSFPMMNSSLDEQSQELVVKHYYNVGVATDTDNGLIVPVVKNVDQKTIPQLAREIQELAERTRTGKIGVEDLRDGTFSITNAGNIGGLFATPVINFPEVAILGVHAIKKTPRVKGDAIVVADVMYLSVSIDHRLVDGATGARWMNVVKDCLENPTKLLLGAL